MMHIIKQTDEEKMAMYMKMPKKKIAEMLIQCNKVLDTQYGAKVFSPNAVLAVSVCDHDWVGRYMNVNYIITCKKCGEVKAN